jgi:hypothetical protein
VDEEIPSREIHVLTHSKLGKELAEKKKQQVALPQLNVKDHMGNLNTPLPVIRPIVLRQHVPPSLIEQYKQDLHKMKQAKQILKDRTPNEKRFIRTVGLESINVARRDTPQQLELKDPKSLNGDVTKIPTPHNCEKR